MKADLSSIPTPLLEAFRVLGIEPIEADAPRRICAWCQTDMAPGSEPATHGICPSCKAKLKAEADALTAAYADAEGVCPTCGEPDEDCTCAEADAPEVLDPYDDDADNDLDDPDVRFPKGGRRE